MPLISGRTRHPGRHRQCSGRGDRRRRRGAGVCGAIRGLPVRRPSPRPRHRRGGSAPRPAGWQPDARHGRRRYATIGANLARRTAWPPADISRNASNIATHEFAQTAQYFTEFPEDIQLIGLSFNTQFQRTGIALQGEVSYRQDVPLQFDDVEVLFAALTPLESGAVSAERAGRAVSHDLLTRSRITTLARCGQLGQFGVNQVVHGLEAARYAAGAVHRHQDLLEHPRRLADGVRSSKRRVHLRRQASRTSSRAVRNDRGLRYNGPGTSVSGNYELRRPPLPAIARGAMRGARAWSSRRTVSRMPTSWGYRIAGRLEYPNLDGAVDSHSALSSGSTTSQGTTPGPAGISSRAATRSRSASPRTCRTPGKLI